MSADSSEIVSVSILVRCSRPASARFGHTSLHGVTLNSQKTPKFACSKAAAFSLWKEEYPFKRRAVGACNQKNQYRFLAASACDSQPEGQPVEGGRGVDL